MSPIADTGGSVVEDPNGGGVGARWAILHAMAELRDAVGEQQKGLIPGALFVSIGISLARAELIPWFSSLNERAIEASPGEVAGIHLDNAGIHLYAEDWDPRDPRRKRPN